MSTKKLQILGSLGDGASITVDTELSDTSTNPVQNKVINEAITTLQLQVSNAGSLATENSERIAALESAEPITIDEALSETSTNPVQNKVVANEFHRVDDALINLAVTIDTALDETSTNPVQNKVVAEKIAELQEWHSGAADIINEHSNLINNNTTALTTHNTSTSAHADIRAEISQLSSEKVDKTSIVQTTGSSATTVMSQKAVTAFMANMSRVEEVPSIVLPNKLYAVAGHEFVLYYRNILRAMRPDDFVVTTSFASGSSLPSLKPLYDGMLRFTPTVNNVGEHILTILVKSRATWNTIVTKDVTLVISEDATRTDKRVMFIGDSLTYASVYAAEVQNLSGNGIMSIGTIPHSIGFNGGTAAIKSEGRNAAASYDYINDQTFAGYNNPFYNPDTEHTLTLDDKYTTGLLTLDNSGSVSVLKHHFDFAYYMANNGDSVGEPDAVFINLGTNGGNKSAYQAVYLAFDAMIERINAYNADLPIFLHLFPPKSEAGSTDRTASGTVSGWLNARTWYYDIIQTFIDRYENDSRVILVPTYTMLDPVYDYKRETVTVSARNSEQITIGQTDGTHPASSGYLHMADSYYNALQAFWSSGEDTIYYTITKNLGDHVSINNYAATAAEGGTYSATLTADNGYTLDSVTATMGGVAVSVTAGVINIPAVTGDIVITATAVEAETPEVVNNLVDPSTANDSNPNLALFADEWVNGYKFSSSSFTSGNLATASGIITTDLVPVNISSKLRIEGFDISTAAKKNELKVVLYNADGTMTRNSYYSVATSTDDAVVDQELLADGVALVTISGLNSATAYPNLTYARISGYPVGGNNSNVVVTVE